LDPSTELQIVNKVVKVCVREDAYRYVLHF